MYYPSVLIVSNNSFSKTSNNGRTLGNLFMGWPKDRIAQFCISTAEPDYDICDNYYLLTDRCMLNSFKRFRKGERCDIQENKGTEGNTIIGGKKVFKTPWKALMRHLIWCGKRWNSKGFQEWLTEFNPELVVVMNSDATFILDIATYITKTRSIPLVMYNTEGFFFFKENYFRPSKRFNNTAFSFYQKIYKRHFKQMMSQVALSVHLNSMLKTDFQEEFGGKHMVLYTGSTLNFDSSNLHTDRPTFTYLGNFGYDRPSALIDVADVLQSINSDYKLDVYGKIPYPEIQRRFDACPGINYKGMIPYDEVVNVMFSSTILFHVESQEDKFEEELHYGFTTKIADSISSGHPFLIYSSPQIAGAKYIIETGAGWHAKDISELNEKIQLILTNDDERNRVLNVAKEVAVNNHNIETNAKKFHKAINHIINICKQ